MTTPERFKGRSADIGPETLKGVTAPVRLFVMNKRTGNMAIADYAAPKDPKAAKPISLKASDFQYVRNMKLNIVSEDDAPLASGVVNITDGDGTGMRTLLTPADDGAAAFHNVATGEISVKVAAKGVKKTIDSTFDLPEERKTAGFEKDIKVSGDVDTLAIAPKSGAGERAAKPKPGGAGGILLTITGLLFVGLIIAIIYAVTKSRGATAESALRKMGVQLPGDEQAEVGPGTPSVDPTICPFCGRRKDAAGNCACSLGAAPASPYAAPAAGVVPRLIGSQGTYSGTIFEIAGSSAAIGRDENNNIALPNDSAVSRRHAAITAANGIYSIRDEGSSNGTFVNGARITEQKLTPGDEVQIGATKFRFEV